MSKIIIHNKSKLDDVEVFSFVVNVMSRGTISQSNFGKCYCFVSTFDHVVVYADITQQKTHTFTIKNRK